LLAALRPIFRLAPLCRRYGYLCRFDERLAVWIAAVIARRLGPKQHGAASFQQFRRSREQKHRGFVFFVHHGAQNQSVALGVKNAAIVKAATDGIASVSIGGQSVQKYTLDQLLNAKKQIDAQLAATQSHFGLRMTKLVPPGTG
jgi:hypothetical protein